MASVTRMIVAIADAYPAQPVMMIVPYPTGADRETARAVNEQEIRSNPEPWRVVVGPRPACERKLFF